MLFDKYNGMMKYIDIGKGGFDIFHFIKKYIYLQHDYRDIDITTAGEIQLDKNSTF